MHSQSTSTEGACFCHLQVQIVILSAWQHYANDPYRNRSFWRVRCVLFSQNQLFYCSCQTNRTPFCKSVCKISSLHRFDNHQLWLGQNKPFIHHFRCENILALHTSSPMSFFPLASTHTTFSNTRNFSGFLSCKPELAINETVEIREKPFLMTFVLCLPSLNEVKDDDVKIADFVNGVCLVWPKR